MMIVCGTLCRNQLTQCVCFVAISTVQCLNAILVDR